MFGLHFRSVELFVYGPVFRAEELSVSLLKISTPSTEWRWDKERSSLKDLGDGHYWTTWNSRNLPTLFQVFSIEDICGFSRIIGVNHTRTVSLSRLTCRFWLHQELCKSSSAINWVHRKSSFHNSGIISKTSAFVTKERRYENWWDRDDQIWNFERDCLRKTIYISYTTDAFSRTKEFQL